MNSYNLTFSCLTGDAQLTGDRIVYEFSISCNSPSDQPTFQIDEAICKLVGQYKYNYAEIKRKLSLPELRKTSVTKPPQKPPQESLEHMLHAHYDESSNVHFDHVIRKCRYLRTSQSEKLKFITVLPETLPPNFRGLHVRIVYKALLAVRINIRSAGKDTKHEQVLQLPLRIYPSAKSYKWPNSLLSQYESAMSESCISQTSIATKSSNPFLADPSDPQDSDEEEIVNGFGPSIDKSFEIPSDFTIDIDAPIKPYYHQPVQPLNPYNEAILTELATSSQFCSFVLSNSSGVIGRLSLLRTSYLIGTEVKGYIDFSNGSVPCLECTFSLKCCEAFHRLQSKPGTPNLTDESTKPEDSPLRLVNEDVACKHIDPEKAQSGQWTTVSVCHLDGCFSHSWMPFSLSIPFSAQPQFTVLNRQIGSGPINIFHTLRWSLALQLQCVSTPHLYHTRTVDHMMKAECLTLPLVNAQGKPVKGELLEWSLPLQMYPPTAVSLHFPKDDARATLEIPR